MREAIVRKLDDHLGVEADETVVFGLDGWIYQTDLTGENAARIRADFAPWVEAAWDKQPMPRGVMPKGLGRKEAPRAQHKKAASVSRPVGRPSKAGRPSLLQPGDEDRIVEMRLADHTTGQVAKHFGVSRATVYRILTERGIKSSNPRPGAAAATKALAIPDTALRRKVRNWARKKGYDVGVKGIISAEVQEEYRKAHNGKLA
jgi:hypothetical protein